MAEYTIDKFTYGGNTYKLQDSLLQNLVDGSTTGSLRGIGTATEDSNYTIGQYAFAEGYNTKASGGAAHAEGGNTIASGDDSHAEGGSTTASGNGSHAEGISTTASGNFSHAEGNNTIAQRLSQTAIGEYNIADTSGSTSTRGNYAFIIGNGTSTNDRSNAFAVKWDGSIEAGGGTLTKSSVSGSRSIAFGPGILANGSDQTVIGKYNDYENIVGSDYAFIIGNGTGTDVTDRSNALKVDWNGNLITSGTIDAETCISAKGEDGDSIEVMAYNRTRSKGLKLSINSNGVTHGLYSDYYSGWVCGVDNSNHICLGGTQFHQLFQVSTGAVTISSITANGYNSATGNTVSKSGYYPIGIVGYDISGTGSGSIPPVKYYLTSQAAGSCKVFAGLHNDSSTARSNITFTATILWVKIL